jgi:hypothetical protein
VQQDFIFIIKFSLFHRIVTYKIHIIKEYFDDLLKFLQFDEHNPKIVLNHKVHEQNQNHIY